MIDPWENMYGVEIKKSNMCLITTNYSIPYSRKYWRSLNLAVLPQTTFLTLLADLNLAVWYGIVIQTCTRKKFWRILIWQFKRIPPNRQI